MIKINASRNYRNGVTARARSEPRVCAENDPGQRFAAAFKSPASFPLPSKSLKLKSIARFLTCEAPINGNRHRREFVRDDLNLI